MDQYLDRELGAADQITLGKPMPRLKAGSRRLDNLYRINGTEEISARRLASLFASSFAFALLGMHDAPCFCVASPFEKGKEMDTMKRVAAVRRTQTKIGCGMSLTRDLLTLAGWDENLVIEASQANLSGVESLKAYIIDKRFNKLEAVLND
jgi:hypothetical protein